VEKNISDYDSALKLLSSALQIYQRQLRADHADVGMVLNLMAEVYQAMGDAQVRNTRRRRRRHRERERKRERGRERERERERQEHE
jgi:hypothetical protein